MTTWQILNLTHRGQHCRTGDSVWCLQLPPCFSFIKDFFMVLTTSIASMNVRNNYGVLACRLLDKSSLVRAPGVHASRRVIALLKRERFVVVFGSCIAASVSLSDSDYRTVSPVAVVADPSPFCSPRVPVRSDRAPSLYALPAPRYNL